MKNINYILFVFLLIICISCNNFKKRQDIVLPLKDSIKKLKRIKTDKYIRINADDFIELPILDTLIKNNPFLIDVTMIPLDKKNGLIGEVNQIEIFNNYIYIHDKSTQNCIFIYDMNGQSVNVINKQGRGPEEYLRINSFDIDTINKEILLCDGLSPYLLFYNLKGEFIRKKRILINVLEAYKIGTKNIYISTLGQNEGIPELAKYNLYTGSYDSIKYKAFEMDNWENQLAIHFKHFVKNYRNELLYVRDFSDTIYHILSDSTYIVHAVLNFKHSRNKAIHNAKTQQMRIKNEMDRKLSHLFGQDFYETSTSIIYDRSLDRKLYYELYDKKSQKNYKLGDFISFKNDLIYSNPIYVHNDYYVGYFEGYKLEYLKKLYDKSKDKKASDNNQPEFSPKSHLLKIIKNAEEYNNGVLLFYKFRLPHEK